MATDADAHTEAMERFEEALDAWSEVRQAALDDLKFGVLGEQWPSDVEKQRKLEGRPCLTINKMPSHMNQVTNDARMNRPTIRVRPVDSAADPYTADVFNGLIRHIEVNSDADIAYDTAIDCSVSQGLGFFRIDLEYVSDSSFDMDIFIRRIANPQSVLFDPRSEAADSSDWRYAFVTDTIAKEAFKAQYPGADAIDWKGKENTGWVTDDEVRIAAYWSREETTRKILLLSNGEVVDADRFEKVKGLFLGNGVTVKRDRTVPGYKVVHRVVSGAEVLETTEWAGKYIPVVPVYGREINNDGKRIFQSLIRNAKDPQRMLNYWRTTATELVALAPKAPWIGEEEAFNVPGEAEKWATANTQSHAFLRYKQGTTAPMRQPFAGIPAGAISQGDTAADDIKTVLGMHDANLGAPSNETSGRAILMRQKEGDVSTFHFVDNLTRAIRCAGKILIDLIPQVYTGERMIRILGEDKKPIMVKIGSRADGKAQPPVAPPASPIGPAVKALLQNLQARMAQQAGPQQPGMPAPSFQLPPELEHILTGMEQVFDLSVGSYDVEAVTGPSFTSRREEASNAILQLVQSAPDLAPILADLLVSNFDFPDADKVMERIQQFQQQKMQQQGGAQGVPDVVGAAKVQAAAKIQTNQESLKADVLMNRDKLAAEAMMAREKMAFDASMKREQQASDQAETHANNLTDVVTTSISAAQKHHTAVSLQPHQMPPFLASLPKFDPNAALPAQ